MLRKITDGLIDGFRAMGEETPPYERYVTRPGEKTEWGAMYEIFDRATQKVVGLDRYQPARERCAALNRQP